MQATGKMRHIYLLFLLISSAGAGGIGRVSKRRAVVASAIDAGAQLISTAAQLLHLHTPADVYHMGVSGSREALIDKLWSGEYESAAGRFTDANPELASIFAQQRLDGREAATQFWAAKVELATVRRSSERFVSIAFSIDGATGDSCIVRQLFTLCCAACRLGSHRTFHQCRNVAHLDRYFLRRGRCP